MLFAILIWALQTAAGYLLVVTLADICLMGVCRPKLGRKAELVNCQKEYYNRRVEIKEFKRLWNTAMLKMPFYRNTFYS